MKVITRKYFVLDKSGCICYLLPITWFEYYKNAGFNGKQFILAFAFLFWEINIIFNEY